MTIELIIEFAIALSIIVFLHEFGHFVACKAVGVEVEEFGFGYPPRALTMFTWRGTKFTLNWLPFGGFNRPKGEGDPNTPGSLAAAGPWKRIAIFLAGPIMSILTAVVLFIAIYGILGSLPDRNRVQLVEISPNSPAFVAGLQAGDILVSVDGVSVHSLDAVRPIIYSHLGQPLLFVYERNNVTHEVTITPLANPGAAGAVGIYMNYPMKSFSIWGAVPESFRSLYDYMRELVSAIGQMIQGQSSATTGSRLVGIKGMFDMYTSVRETVVPGVPTIVNVFLFFASISISLGLLNLLPIPALDGGRIVFALPEIIIRKRIPPKYEMWVNFISFALLILLMIIINAR
ncbi:MAG TPA: M50 family metallopeptidase, partial [Anaerolineales bacterium]|nr:M50 family metallopeptidase [Anaerolineales bacterium]